ncbi:MAG: SufE family protein [Pseudobdellovibrionaceae bacterium]
MSAVQERQKKIVQDFSVFANWEDKYKKIIEMGRALPEMPEALKTEEAKVKGCQSQVWLHAALNDKKEIVFQADSDAMITKGLIAILVQVYSQATPQDILASPADFLKELGLESHLSPSRANGLFSMLKQIRYYATAFQYMLSKT